MIKGCAAKTGMNLRNNASALCTRHSVVQMVSRLSPYSEIEFDWQKNSMDILAARFFRDIFL